jgi:hypothetical protein
MTPFEAVFNFLAGLAVVIYSGIADPSLVHGVPPTPVMVEIVTPEPEATATEEPVAEATPEPIAEATPEPPPMPDGSLEDEPVTVTPIPDVCDISYPTMCIPVGASDVLNCADITQRRFPVVGHDSQGFDANHNGIGCESR